MTVLGGTTPYSTYQSANLYSIIALRNRLPSLIANSRASFTWASLPRMLVFAP